MKLISEFTQSLTESIYSFFEYCRLMNIKMELQEILQNNPDTWVADAGYERDVYDVVNRRIVGEYSNGSVVTNPRWKIPEQYIDMVAALMTSRTPFYRANDYIVFYARSRLWICTDNQLTPMHLIPDKHRSYFDESPLSIHMYYPYVRVHQSRNVILMTKCETGGYDAPDHILIIFPATFIVVKTELYQPFLMQDSETQETYSITFMHYVNAPREYYLKLGVKAYPDSDGEVYIDVDIIID